MSRGSEEPSDFDQRKKDYFADLLRRKWECEASGHGVCVRTTDGGHHQISKEGFAKWVEALSIGEATTSQPPFGILDNSKGIRKSPESSLIAVSLPPSRLRNIGSPSLAASASFNSSRSSWASSGVPGPGYYSGKAIKWLGGRSLDAIEMIIVYRRVRKYRDHLRSWEEKTWMEEVEPGRQKEMYQILEDIVEMSRPCYSVRVNNAAEYIGHVVGGCCLDIPQTKDMAFFLCQIEICLSLVNLNISARFDSVAEDLSSDLRDALSRAPLALQDAATMSAVIQILALDLVYSPHWSGTKYRWIGQIFTLIVARTLQLRYLTDAEMGAVRSIAQRCQRDCDERPMACRTWEIALLAACAWQEQSFRDVVLGRRGIPSLYVTLEFLLSDQVHDTKTDSRDWGRLESVLWTLERLSRYPRAVQAMTQRPLRPFLDAFRKSPPNPQFRIHFWTVSTLCNMVRHSPSVLPALHEENAPPVLELARHALTSLLPNATHSEAWLQRRSIELLDELSKEIISYC